MTESVFRGPPGEFMVEGRHVEGWDVFSSCEQYRYRLRYTWGDWALDGGLGCIGQNPSKANRHRTDPTVVRMIKRAMRAGYGGFEMMNAYARIETDSDKFWALPDPIRQGPVEADFHLHHAIQSCSAIVVAWGGDRRLADRMNFFAARLRQTGKPLLCLGYTKDGAPRHPSRLGYAVQLEPWGSAP